MSWLTGLLHGINEEAEYNRREVRRREDEQDQFERRELARITADESYTPEVRERAATGLLEIAANPQKRRKGSFLDRLLGVDQIEAHPAVSQVFQFMRGSEAKSLPSGLARTTPRPQTASAPGSAAQPPTPAGEAGGGPQTPAQMGSPGGPPPRLQMGQLPIDESTGAPPQTMTPPVMMPRRIMRTAGEIMLENARAKAQGDVEGEVAGLIAAGMPHAQALDLVRQSMIRRTGSGVASAQSVAGEVVDPETGIARPTFGVFDRARMTYVDPITHIPITGFRPRTTTGSSSMGTDREAISRANFSGRRYVDLLPAEQQQVLQLEQQMNADQAAATESARAGAAAVAPLSTPQRTNEEAALRKELSGHDEAYQTMAQQYQVMRTALDRFGTDPVGAVEGIRVTFAKILDPTSVVREAEYARQGFGLSAFDRLQGLWQKYAQGGGEIPEPILREMVETARQFVVGAAQRSAQIRQRYTDIATRQGLNPANVTGVLGVGSGPPSLPGPGTFNAPPVTTPTGGQGGAVSPPPRVVSPGGANVPMALPGATPPTVPARGAAVGNRYVGPMMRSPDGRILGRVDGRTVVLTQGPDGQWRY